MFFISLICLFYFIYLSISLFIYPVHYVFTSPNSVSTLRVLKVRVKAGA